MERHGQTIETPKAAYEAPSITRLEADDVLRIFQMTAAQISAAGCWWTTKSHSTA